jgi:uncharacterized membrane protein
LLTLVGRFKPTLHNTSWLLLVLGGLAAVPTVITGLIAHKVYEGAVSVSSMIQNHQLLGIIGAVLTLVVLVWRWWSRRKGHDAGLTTPILLLHSLA